MKKNRKELKKSKIEQPRVITVHEIARLAGVSIGTVDRVLHKRGRVSAETRARVEGIIEKYQFTPNPFARRLKLNRPCHFYALLPRREQDAGYWGQIIAGIERAAGEIKSLGAQTEIVEFDRYDAAAFESVSASILALKPDGLLFTPIMQKTTRPFVEKALACGIPLVFADTDIPQTAPLCVIGQDPFKGGYLAGRLFHLFAAAAASAPVAVLDAHGDDYHISRRRDGFLLYAQERGFQALVKEYSDYKGSDISVGEISLFLKKSGRLSGLFITNCMAHRVAEAAGPRKGGAFPLIGYDLTPGNRRMLLEGRIDAIISQRPEEQGREAVLTLFRSVVLRQKVEARLEIPLDVYIRENTPPD